MSTSLTNHDIDEKYQEKISTESYEKKPVIEGVQIVELKNFTGEDGDFSELIRVTPQGELEQFPDFFLRQVNRSKLTPGTIKAWHLHYNQEDIWHILPQHHVLVGLLDLRKNSSTKHTTMRLALGLGKSHLVFIPRGVAHGVANISKRNATMLYFVNQQFSLDTPDEHRLPWDILGEDFWKPIKG